jgi:hypothetical protein
MTWSSLLPARLEPATFAVGPPACSGFCLSMASTLVTLMLPSPAQAGLVAMTISAATSAANAHVPRS